MQEFGATRAVAQAARAVFAEFTDAGTAAFMIQGRQRFADNSKYSRHVSI
jgi:hypothetical protein